ncbi:TaqI-like C-terminal specificity domain-containing protein [Clostridium sp. LBM24168]
MDRYKVGQNYENSMNASWRKKNGAFYTPYNIVDFLLKNTMKDIDVLENPFVKVLDPACGCGFFLIGAYKLLFVKFKKNLEALRKKFGKEIYEIDGFEEKMSLSGYEYWSENNLSYHLLKNCIFGSDIDPVAVEMTKNNLYSFSRNKFNLDLNVVCCNSLIKWNEDYDFCAERRDLNVIVDFWSKKYDYVVGNPPWVSLSRKFKNTIDNKLEKYYLDKYDGNRYLPNLYEYFIKRSFELLDKNGKVGVVIPDRFASNIQYKNFRKYILERYNVIHLAFEIEFPGINTDVMIFIAENNYDMNNKIIVDGKDKIRYTVNQIDYKEDPNTEFCYSLDNRYRRIKDIVEAESCKLRDICTTFTGFIGNKNIITGIRRSKAQIEILKGRNISSYSISGNYYYNFIDKNIKGGTKNIEKLKYKNKIVLRKTGKDIIAAIDNRGYVIEQSLYGIISKNKQFSVEYILGILNSKLMQWYYRNFLVTNYKSMPQIKKYSLDRIPIKICSNNIKYNIEKLVFSMINCTDDVRRNLLQEKVDFNIFELYGLGQDDRDLILKLLKK